MNLPRRGFLYGSIILSVLVIAVLITTGNRGSVTMASGAVVRLQSVTFGKEHRFVYGTIWQRLKARLPEKLFGPSGVLVLTHHTTNDSVVAWLVWKGTHRVMLRTAHSYAVANDLDQPVMIESSVAWQRADDETTLEGRELLLPGRCRTPRLQFYEPDDYSKPVCVGEFRLPTRSRKGAQTWQPEKLPIRRVDQGVEFTLTRFVAENEVRTDRGLVAALSTMNFQISELGKRSTNWQLLSIQASDALGNRNGEELNPFSENRDVTWTGTWLLWPDEPAWKLCLEFTRYGAFDPAELWHVPGIPVSKNVSFDPGRFQTNLAGVRLAIGITDVRGFLPDGRRGLSATPHVLEINRTGSVSRFNLELLEARDDQGKTIPVIRWLYLSDVAIGYELNLASHVRSVNALVAVRRNRYFEFVAKPEVLTTNRPKSRPEN